MAVWIAAGASLHRVKGTGNQRDFWGWACAKETHKQMARYERFKNKVDFDLICTMQNVSIPGGIWTAYQL